MPVQAQIEGIGTVEFPDGTSPDIVHQTVRKLVMQHNAPKPLSGLASEAPQPIQGGALGSMYTGAQDLAKGVGKGVLAFGQGALDHMAPKGSFFNSDPVDTTANGTAQGVGKVLGEVGSGAALAAPLSAEALPAISGAAPVLGRVAIPTAKAAATGAAIEAADRVFHYGADKLKEFLR